VPPFEEIDHTADWAFRVHAKSREELFADAAQALYELGGVRTNPPGESKTLRLRADDLEGLFIQWLNELLFLIDHDHAALRGIRIRRLTDTDLEASGNTAEVESVGKYIKAATYSGLRIREENGEWQATVVLDV
jgi:SHS2 domain-containing protein